MYYHALGELTVLPQEHGTHIALSMVRGSRYGSFM